MKKITLLIGAGIGFLAGSRAGNGPYEQLEAKLREVTKRPKVQEAVNQAKSAAGDKVDAVAGTVSDTLPSKETTSDDQTTSDPTFIPTTETLVSPPFVVP